MSEFWGLMYTMAIIASNIVLYSWKLLRPYIHHKKCYYDLLKVLANGVVVIALCICISSQHVVYLKPVCAVLSCFSRVWLIVTLWTVAHQGPLSIRFPRQNTGVSCDFFFLQGIFPTQGLNLCLLGLLHWQVGSLPLVPSGKILSLPNVIWYCILIKLKK